MGQLSYPAYLSALKRLHAEDRITRAQKDMLRAHVARRNLRMSNGEFERAGLVANHRGVHSAYGALAQNIARHTRARYEGCWTWLIAKYVGRDDEGLIRWRLHGNFARAVRDVLGFARPMKQTGAAPKPTPLDRRNARDKARLGGGFGRAESNVEVEKKAIAAAKRHYSSQGYQVKSVEWSRKNYDLECRRGGRLLCVEVKGTSGPKPRFVITRGEVKALCKRRCHEVFVLVDALQRPTRRIWSCKEFFRAFDLEPISYMAREK